MDIRENYKKRIVLADKVNHEQSDKELYRKFEKHETLGDFGKNGRILEKMNI